MRNLVKNKYKLLKYATLIGKRTSEYGEDINVYSDIKEIWALIKTENSNVEYSDYGLTVDDSLKVLIDKKYINDFTKDTIIFIDKDANKLKNNFNFRVSKEPIILINQAILSIKKVVNNK